MSSLKLRISPKIFIFIVAEMSFFILRVKTSIEIFFFMFIMFAVFFIFNLFVLLLNLLLRGKLVISRDIQEKITQGQLLSVQLSVSNLSHVFFMNIAVSDFLGCDLKEKDKKFFIDWLGRKSEFKLSYGCVCEKRGLYGVGPVKVSFLDFLGLFSLEEDYGLKTLLYVYPQTFDIRYMMPLVRGRLPWFGLETTAISGDDHDFFGVREYKRGDPIKRVHWLSTARKGVLIVREYQRISFYRVSLIFVLNQHENIGGGKESVAEYIIKISASLAKYFVQKNICVELLAHAGKIAYFPSNRGGAYLEELFKFFTVAEAKSKIKPGDFLQENYRIVSSDSTIFLLITENNMDSVYKILSLKEQNVSLVVLILVASTFAAQGVENQDVSSMKSRVAAELAHMNIKVLFFCKGDDLAAVFARGNL
ncbi:MAG: DUF58 domain-containing protein [Candidatus Omnitrophota bacterium]